jgi:maltose alpha-D-glucosyltransferase / alpha-amylase
VRLRLDVERGHLLANLIDPDETVADDRGDHHLELEPYGYRWYRVGGLTSARPG